MKERRPAGNVLRNQVLSLCNRFDAEQGDVFVPTLGAFPVQGDARNPRLEARPDIYPPLIDAEDAASILRYTTADIRKMWPSLSRTFGLTEERPRGDDIGVLLRKLLAVPFGGAAFFRCALEAKVARPFGLFRSENGLGLPLRREVVLEQATGAYETVVVETVVCEHLLINAWIFGEVPDLSQYDEIRKHVGIKTEEGSAPLEATFRYLDYLRSLSPDAASGTPTTKAPDRPSFDTPASDACSDLFRAIAERISDIASVSELGRVADDTLLIEAGVRHLRTVAEYANATRQGIPAALLNPLLERVQQRIELSNQATKPQYEIAPLPVTQIPPGAPYLSEELRFALEAARGSGEAVAPCIDEFNAARAAMAAHAGMASDADFERLSFARRALLDTAKLFGNDVDLCRPHFDGAAPVASNADIPDELKVAYALAVAFAGQLPPPPSSQTPTPALDDPKPADAKRPDTAQPENTAADSVGQAGEGIIPDAEPEQEPATPSAPVVDEAPNAPEPRLQPEKADAPPPPQAQPPAEEESPSADIAEEENPEAVSLIAVSNLLIKGNPGIALALARIHEEALFNELPGGPAFYALLCGAAATCGVDTPHFDGLARPLDTVSQVVQMTDDADLAQALAMAYLAAAAKPALLSVPVAYHLHVIGEQLGIPALIALASLLEEPIRQNLPTSIESLRESSGLGEEARKESLALARSTARSIIENIEVRHDFNSHPPSQSTWRHLRSAQHPIGAALHALADGLSGNDLGKKLKVAVDLVEDGCEEVVDNAFNQYSKVKLISTNRERLCSAMERIGDFLNHASRLVHPPKLQSGEAARLANFTSRVIGGIGSAVAALKAVKYAGARDLARLVLIMVLDDIKAMLTSGRRRTLGIDEYLLRDLTLADIDLGVEINDQGSEGKTLYALGRESRIHGERTHLLDVLRQCSPQPHADIVFSEAARRHIDAGRVLSALAAITALRAQAPEHADLPALTNAYEALRTEARMDLRAHAASARKALARVAFSSLLTPDEVVRYEAAVDAVIELAKSLPIEGPITGPLTNDRPTDFITARQFLDGAVVEPLNHLQAKAVKAFEERVKADRDSVPDALQPSVDKVLSLAREGQIVSAEEFWSQLLKGMDLPRLVGGPSLLREFHTQYLPDPAQSRSTTTPAESLSAEAQQAQRQLLNTWQGVTQAGQTGASRTLVAFLTALVQTDVATVGTLAMHGSVGLHEVAGLDFARAVGSETFVVPIIGSSSKTRFRVAVVYGAGSLTTIREALSHGADVILTKQKLGLDDRRRLYSDVRSKSRGALIIDEHLVQFAALVPSSAAARVVAVASSFLYTEPYKVEDATTPEMYFGRRAARRQIFEARTALIFGGRRLGKSSIIADICRRETSPAQKKFYVHVELNQFMEADNYADEVWQRIAQALVDSGAVARPQILFNMGNSKAVLETLKRSFSEDRITHLTIYLDEADRFMKLEEATNFRVLYELSNELTQRWPDRFSYAISGLNNVQRISLGWNTRLGRIGDPIAITPFIDEDRHEGLRLIVEPLAALGFEFESPDLPLQILSAASFYPALIQGYCSKLLELLYKTKLIDGVPPYVITQSDLANTESTEELRRKFLDIFKLTVLLDNRYIVVCAILAEEQEYREGADVSMLLSAISERAVQVAPNLFPKSDPTTIVEAAAESLINLGLLVRQPNTQLYQFRSPRILSKIREISQVTDFLKGDANRPQFTDHDPAEHRPRFSDGSVCPLPERLVNSVCAPSMAGEATRFITGSEATGLLRLRKLGQDAAWASRRVKVLSGHAENEGLLKTLIGQISEVRHPTKGKLSIQKTPQERELIVVGGSWLPSAPDRISEVEAALHAEHRSVLLICEPDRAWDLAARPGMRMNRLPHWTPSALRLHLQAIELPDFIGETSLERLIEVTGGCSALIEVACQRLATQHAIPATIDLLHDLKVTDVKALFALFGLRGEHADVINRIPTTPQPRADLEKEFKAQDVDAHRLFTYLEWMGVLQVNEKGGWSLNPVLTTGLLEL